jgi:hypothetical protein
MGLTKREYKIVHLLVSNVGRWVTYRAIYDCMHYDGFIAGGGDDGYRGNVRSAIKRIRKMEWPASTIIHPRATANTMASVVAPSNSSNMRHCCGRPSVASYKARVQGLEFGLARHWSRLARPPSIQGRRRVNADVSFPTSTAY